MLVRNTDGISVTREGCHIRGSSSFLYGSRFEHFPPDGVQKHYSADDSCYIANAQTGSEPFIRTRLCVRMRRNTPTYIYVLKNKITLHYLTK